MRSKLNRERLSNEISGGLTGGIASAAAYIPIGLVAYAPLGAALAGTGMLTVFYGAIIGGGLFLALRRTPGLLNGPTMPMALVVAGLMTALVADGALVPGGDDAGPFVAVVILLGVLTAACAAILALTGLGRLVPLVPFPVIAGIVNGGALLLVIAQFRTALGLQAGQPGRGPSLPFWAHPGALIVSAVTFALMIRPIRRIRIVPVVLVALFAGSAVHYALAAATVPGFVGPLLGPIPGGFSQARDVAAGWAALLHLPPWPLALAVLPAALSLAMLATLDTLLGASTMQDLSFTHGSARPDLLAVAAGILLGGLAGALPASGNTNASVVTWNAGGRTRLAGYVRLGVMLAIVLLLPAAMARLPTPVLAGIVIASAWRLFDRESIRYARLALRPMPRRRWEMLGNSAIVVVVMAIAVTGGMIAAVLAGGLLALLLFATSMAQSVVRRRQADPAGRSRIARARPETELLRAQRRLIEIVELQGSIFFGSADQVAREVEAALGRGARHVILDMRRVTSVDLSGARRLLQNADRFWRSGTSLLIACVRPGTPVWSYLHDLGLLARLRPDHVFTGLEEALDHAERQILGTALEPAGERAATPAGTLEALGFPPVPAARFAALLPVLTAPAGAPLIRAGDPSDTFFILLEGAVDVYVTLSAGEGARTRLATLTAGLIVGEMGYLNGAPRSADVVARTPTTFLRVEASLVERSRQIDSDIAYHLMRAIAGQLERNLRMANALLLSFEE